MAIWTGVFNVGSWYFQSINDGTKGRRSEDTRVAVVDGRIVSTVDVFYRQLRGLDGNPVLIGAIGSVATLPEARRQGHSGRLLEDAIMQMGERGCAWSFLFTGVHDHYERYGWRRVPLPYRAGDLREALSDLDDLYEIRRLQSPYPLPDFLALYDEFNRHRPLVHIRSASYWQTAIQVRLDLPDRRVWGAFADGRLTGYALASFSPGEGGSVQELAYADGERAAVLPLLAAIRTAALDEQISRLTVTLPNDPAINDALDALLERREEGSHPWGMARPIAEGVSAENLQSLFAAPDAHNYDLDAF